MQMKEVRVLGTGLKERNYQHYVDLAVGNKHHSFDLAVEIASQSGCI
jgi:hypothetical protein